MLEANLWDKNGSGKEQRKYENVRRESSPERMIHTTNNDESEYADTYSEDEMVESNGAHTARAARNQSENGGDENEASRNNEDRYYQGERFINSRAFHTRLVQLGIGYAAVLRP